jgi:microcystin-dependent protein
MNPVVSGVKRGQESITLTVDQLPAHTHEAKFTQSNAVVINIPVSTVNGNDSIPSANANKLAVANNSGDPISMWTSNQTNPVNIGGVTTSGGDGRVINDNTGKGVAVPTLPPQLGMMQCIVVDGIYPTRPNQ